VVRWLVVESAGRRAEMAQVAVGRVSRPQSSAKRASSPATEERAEARSPGELRRYDPPAGPSWMSSAATSEGFPCGLTCVFTAVISMSTKPARAKDERGTVGSANRNGPGSPGSGSGGSAST